MHFLLLIDLKFYTIMYTMVDALTAQERIRPEQDRD